MGRSTINEDDRANDMSRSSPHQPLGKRVGASDGDDDNDDDESDDDRGDGSGSGKVRVYLPPRDDGVGSGGREILAQYLQKIEQRLEEHGQRAATNKTQGVRRKRKPREHAATTTTTTPPVAPTVPPPPPTPICTVPMTLAPTTTTTHVASAASTSSPMYQESLTVLKGIGKTRMNVLSRAGLHTLGDVIRLSPTELRAKNDETPHVNLVQIHHSALEYIHDKKQHQHVMGSLALGTPPPPVTSVPGHVPTTNGGGSRHFVIPREPAPSPHPTKFSMSALRDALPSSSSSSSSSTTTAEAPATHPKKQSTRVIASATDAVNEQHHRPSHSTSRHEVRIRDHTWYHVRISCFLPNHGDHMIKCIVESVVVDARGHVWLELDLLAWAASNDQPRLRVSPQLISSQVDVSLPPWAVRTTTASSGDTTTPSIPLDATTVQTLRRVEEEVRTIVRAKVNLGVVDVR